MCDQMTIKAELQHLRQQQHLEAVAELQPRLPEHLHRAMELGSEKGASSWLSILPIEEHGFSLHKVAFRDALCLRYGWTPSHLASHCVCSHPFSIDHALTCPTGGYPTIRHNELRDLLPK